MNHFDLVTGRAVWLRPHSGSPWERWTVGRLMPRVAELERQMAVDYARKCVGDETVSTAIRDRTCDCGGDPSVITFRLLAIRLPDGRLTDESGHNIEMREVA